MPNNNPRLPKRSWRDEGSSEKGHAPGRRKWHKEGEAKGPAEPRFGRGAKITLAAVALVVVGVGIKFVIDWLIPPKPFTLVLVEADYATNLAIPPNVPGKRAVNDLDKWAEDYSDKQWAGDKEKGIARKRVALGGEDDAFAKALENCKSPTVVAFLAVHGGTDSKGSFLVPNDASLRNRDGLYRLTKVLDALAGLPEKTKKLLVLDVTGAEAIVPLGMLHNHFVRDLRAEVERRNVPRLLVIASSAENQRSWPSENFGRTAFAHYFLEGLRGAADKDNHGSVTVQMLFKYVSDKVYEWARHNREALQTPILLGDLDLAADMELVRLPGAYQPGSPSSPADLTKTRLGKHWKDRADLEKQVPHPAAFAPLQWRQYQDTLFRYEALLRYGDEADADVLEGDLKKLKGEIEQARRREGKVLTNSLAMPTALGWSITGEETKAVDPFERLWEEGKSTKEIADQLQGALNASGVTNLQAQLRRVRLSRLLLDKARGSEKDFVRACGILRALDDAGSLRPAEAHFALMVDHVFTQYLEKSWKWPTLQLALEVRVLAESAALGLNAGATGGAAYSERVLPWIQSQIDSADKLRRQGEDLLFGSASEVVEAEKVLKEAKQQYVEAQTQAEKVREAFRVRDRALADLPYLGQWLVRQGDESKIKAHVELWDKVHDLCDRLAKPDVNEVDVLRDKAKKIRDDLVKVDEEFRAGLKEVAGEGAIQKHWHEIDGLLTAPFIASDRRLELIAQQRTIGNKLLAEMDKAESPQGVTPEKTEQDARQTAWRRGRLTLAASPNADERKNVDVQLRRADEKSWWEPLGEAGEKLADGQRRLAETASKEAADARKSILEKAMPVAASAARSARLLDGAAAKGLGADPVGEDRALELHRLFTWQAQRTYLDYWASENPDKNPDKPYFRAAGSLYLKESLVGLSDVQKNGLPDGDRKVRTSVHDGSDVVELRLLRAGRLRANRLHLTDEPDVSLDYEAAGKDGVQVPEGRPVVWGEAGRLVGLKPGLEGRTALGKVGPDPEKATKTYVINRKPPPSANALQGDTDFTAHLVFRGRHHEVKTPVRLHYQPDLTLAQPAMPPEGRIVVQADRDSFSKFAADNTELVIVLDCSGSMGHKRNKDAKDVKIEEALDALGRGLRKVPENVRVSLFTFTATEGRPRIDRFWNREPWHQKDRNKRLADLGDHCRDKVSKNGGTPLVRATWEASQIFGESKAKTLVIITDGGDSTFRKADWDQDLKKNGATIKQFIHNKFKNTDVQFKLISYGFDPTDPSVDPDEKSGKDEFEGAFADLGVEAVEPKDGTELATLLERFFLQIQFWVDPDRTAESGRPFPKDALYPVSLIDENFYQRIAKVDAPWPWWVRLQANDKKRNVVQKLVDVKAGDRLVLDLVPSPDGRGFELRRDLYVKHHNLLSQPENPKGTEWYLGVQRNEPDPLKDSLHLMATLEKDVREQVVHQYRPQLAWFQVAPKDHLDQPPAGQRVTPLIGYPAPAYDLDLARWPPGQTPVLHAWWVESKDKLVSANALDLQRGRDFNTLADLREKERDAWLVANEKKEKVVIESVAVEPKRRIEYVPGERQERECLVVRLRYENGATPYFAQISGTLAEEHNFYTEAGKYVGVFVLGPGQRADELPALNLVSVEAAKRAAVHVEKPLDLGPPDKTKGRPPLLGNERD
jgi:Mg-chelatase subunit ChlD